MVKSLEDLQEKYPNTVLTIGNFDGVHLGHQKIISTVLKRARDLRGTPMAMTFDPHPLKIIAPERELQLLTSFDERAKLMEELGIKVFLLIPFTKDFSSLPPDEFITDILVKRIKAKEIIVGTNYAFGKNRKGNVDLLRRRGKKYGYAVKVIRNARILGVVVSSSMIRELILKGTVSDAIKFLGRAYSIEGTVIKGKGRGKSLLNIPTANITKPLEIVPKEGVYAVRVMYRSRFLDGVANIGKNPTFTNDDMSYEVHLFNFYGNLLGKKIRIFFIDRIRNEQRFSHISILEKQIRNDIECAKELLRINHPKLI
jgi:riboflavin kinase/FMN adenylyltransferase